MFECNAEHRKNASRDGLKILNLLSISDKVMNTNMWKRWAQLFAHYRNLIHIYNVDACLHNSRRAKKYAR